EKSYRIPAGTFGTVLTVRALSASSVSRWPSCHLDPGLARCCSKSMPRCRLPPLTPPSNTATCEGSGGVTLAFKLQCCQGVMPAGVSNTATPPAQNAWLAAGRKSCGILAQTLGRYLL